LLDEEYIVLDIVLEEDETKEALIVLCSKDN